MTKAPFCFQGDARLTRKSRGTSEYRAVGATTAMWSSNSDDQGLWETQGRVLDVWWGWLENVELGWGGGMGRKAYNCNWITIKIKKKKKENVELLLKLKRVGLEFPVVGHWVVILNKLNHIWKQTQTRSALFILVDTLSRCYCI